MGESALGDKKAILQLAHSDYARNQQLIDEARRNGFRWLRLPSELEQSFVKHFSEQSRSQFYSSFYFLFVPTCLVLQLFIFQIDPKELLEIIRISESNTANDLFSGIGGYLRIHTFIALILASMLYLPKNPLIKDSFQLFISLSVASILALTLISYALVNDPRFIFTLEMELIFTYIYIFTLLRLQLIFVLLASFLATIVFILSLYIFVLVPNWGELVGIISAMNLFGFIYVYRKEYQAREAFIDLLEIQNKNRQLSYLNEKTERENRLKAELSKFYATMSGEKDIHILGDKILSFLIPYLNANLGSIYIVKDQELILLKQYAASEQYQLKETFKLGEGLLGQAALDRKAFQLDQSPEGFHTLQTGLGKLEKPALFIMPLMFDDEVIAVLEVASISPISEYHLEFLENASRSVSAALKAVSAKSGF